MVGGEGGCWVGEEGERFKESMMLFRVVWVFFLFFVLRGRESFWFGRCVFW